MAANRTHNEIELRPPHGARFLPTAGASVLLVIARGKERETIEYLKEWINGPLETEARKYEIMQKKKEDFENSPEAVQEKLRELAPDVAAQLDAIPSARKEPKQCEQCGIFGDYDASFCKNCGMPVTPVVANVTGDKLETSHPA